MRQKKSLSMCARAAEATLLPAVTAHSQVCRSFGGAGTGGAEFLRNNRCGGSNFSVEIGSNCAQHGLKMLDGVLYGSGCTG